MEENGKRRLANGELEALLQSKAIARIQDHPGMTIATKFKIFKIIETIRKAPGFEAYLKAKQLLIAKHEQEKTPLLTTDPELQELWREDSGVEIDHPTLSAKELPEDITIKEMQDLSWLFEFVE